MESHRVGLADDVGSRTRASCTISAFNRYPMGIEKRGYAVENIYVIAIKFMPHHIGLVLKDCGVIPEQFGHSELAFF